MGFAGLSQGLGEAEVFLGTRSLSPRQAAEGRWGDPSKRQCFETAHFPLPQPRPFSLPDRFDGIARGPGWMSN